MKFIINKQNGFVELLLVTPIFLGIFCMIAGCMYLLIQKSKLEKVAWTYQTQKTYGITTSDIHPYQLKDNSSLSTTIQNISIQMHSLPLAFQAFLTSNPSESKRLTLSGKLPHVFQHLGNAAFDFFEPHDSKIPLSHFDISTDVLIPGSSFEKSWTYKNALWIEDMKKAGFDYIVLQSLGIKEILDSGSIPSSDIGSEIAGKVSKATFDQQETNQ